MERSLEEERAPRLEPVLHEEGEGEHEPDDEQRTGQPRAPLPRCERRIRPEIRERGQHGGKTDTGQDPGRMRACMPQQSRADATDEDPARERGVQSVHDPNPVQRLEPCGMGVDRDVQKAGADPDDGEKEDEHRNGVREARQPFHRTEEHEEDRDEPRPEDVREPSRHQHRRQSGERDAQQREPELRVARSRRALDRGQTRSPRAPEQPEDRVGRGKAPRSTQGCRYRSTRLCSCRRRNPSRISRARTAPTPVIASRSR